MRWFKTKEEKTLEKLKEIAENGYQTTLSNLDFTETLFEPIRERAEDVKFLILKTIQLKIAKERIEKLNEIAEKEVGHVKDVQRGYIKVKIASDALYSQVEELNQRYDDLAMVPLQRKRNYALKNEVCE